MVRADHFWRPKSVRPTTFGDQKWSAGPLLGRTTFAMTVLHVPNSQQMNLGTPRTKSTADEFGIIFTDLPGDKYVCHAWFK